MDKMIAQRPGHVSVDRVYEFDYLEPPGHHEDVHLAWNALHNDEVPDIFWTPYYGGHWIVTRAEDIEVMQQDYENFSMHAITIPPHPSGYVTVPTELDPPEHTPYRKLLTPRFSPTAVTAMKDAVVRLTNGLIDSFIDDRECEFVAQFAKRLPVDIFLTLVDLPFEERDELLETAEKGLRGTLEEKKAASERMTEYARYWLDKRRAKPGDDLISLIATAEIDGQPIPQERAIGMFHTVLFGGLDTVASALGFITRFLAENPAHRRRLIEQPDIIPMAIEEMLRRFGIPQTARVITHDMQYKGVTFKKGEQVMVAKSLHGLDERKYPDPLTVDFDRKPRDHAAFGSGVHRCVGAGLARNELQVFIEEWLQRIPDFQIKPGEKPVTSSGNVNGMLYLPLVW